MGVDYTAHRGLGFKVECHDDSIDDFFYFLDEKIDGEKYSIFEVGEGVYTGDENDVYVIIKDPFRDGIIMLYEKKNELINHLTSIGVKIDSDFGVVGGLEVS